jgi:23S rRNA pseudouridine1911/1915/1917 synthase
MKEVETETIIIADEEAGERLDKILAHRYREIRSRTYFQFLIDEHLVLLNGIPVKKRIKPKAGDEIEIQFVLTSEIDLIPEAIPLDILYEDEAILVINKPPGLVVHPAPGNWTGTFVNALLYHCKHISPEKGNLRPGIVHRLDKDTSGVLVAAKTALAQQRLVEMFAQRDVYKEYLAICIGNPGDIEIETSIGRHPVQRKLMKVLPQGKAAKTICQTLSFDGKLAIAKIILTTGRTHQIRVHMKHHGTPILGDAVYGSEQQNKKYGISRQMLHAHRLQFLHPITKEMMQFEAPVPDDMRRMVKKIDPKFEERLCVP